MNNVHNWKCSNMQMAHITHMNNVRCTLYAVLYVWTKQNYLFNFTFIERIYGKRNVLQHKGIDIWRLRSITKYNNNIIFYVYRFTFDVTNYYVDHLPFTNHIYIRNETKRNEFNNVCKCCNILIKNYSFLMRMARFRSKKIIIKWIDGWFDQFLAICEFEKFFILMTIKWFIGRINWCEKYNEIGILLLIH